MVSRSVIIVTLDTCEKKLPVDWSWSHRHKVILPYRKLSYIYIYWRRAATASLDMAFIAHSIPDSFFISFSPSIPLLPSRVFTSVPRMLFAFAINGGIRQGTRPPEATCTAPEWRCTTTCDLARALRDDECITAAFYFRSHCVYRSFAHFVLYKLAHDSITALLLALSNCRSIDTPNIYIIKRYWYI